jgi:hypothetical protein
LWENFIEVNFLEMNLPKKKKSYQWPCCNDEGPSCEVGGGIFLCENWSVFF